jgi:hypothetical protein
MDVWHACCAGSDVDKKTVVACVRRVDPAGKVARSIKTFAAMTADLLSCELTPPIPAGRILGCLLDRKLPDLGVRHGP